MPTITAAIADKTKAAAEICRRFGVARLEVFGSACTADFDAQRSDVDFLVEFPPGANLGPWLSRLFELQTALCRLYGRPVDVIMSAALRDPWFRREAEKTRTILYDASQESQMAS
jgi:predicted nucleotidyltransferase